MIASHQPGNGSSHQIAHSLARAISTALAARGETPPEARTLAWQAAVDLAELLELTGLSTLLSACTAHAADPPLAVANVFLRLARLVSETEARGDITSFLEADRELASLAGMITSQYWGAPEVSHGAERSPVSLLPLADVLTELELDRPATVAEAQVTMPVAAALRAALDWIGADTGGAMRVQLQDAALQLSTRPSHEPGLRAAGAVLAAAGGALVSEPDGRWALRVPLHRDQPAYLLARQGELALAIPWHAVARLRIADAAARVVLTEPSLAPWSPLERAQGERPAALLAWGLTRAWLHLDHIVWRVFARPEPAETSDAVPGSRHVVRTDDGRRYDVVDVAAALAGVPPLDTPAPRPRPRTGPEPTLLTPAAEPAPAPALRVLGPENVRPLTLTPAVAAPPPTLGPSAVTPRVSPREVAAAGHPPQSAPAESEPTGPSETRWAAPGPAEAGPTEPEPTDESVLRALIVDDSLVARIALGRALEREGWLVEGVERADEMWRAIEASPWTVVFVDVSLPDASGGEHLQELVDRVAGAPHPFELVALTRDESEEQDAFASGIVRTLRKPFTPALLARMVDALPISRGQA